MFSKEKISSIKDVFGIKMKKNLKQVKLKLI